MGWSSFLKNPKDAAEVVKFFGKGITHGLETVSKNWKGVGATIVGWNYFVNDKSIVEQGGEIVLGEDAVQDYKEKGALGVGENAILGRERSEKLNDSLASAVESAGNAAKSLGQGVQNAYHNGAQMVSNMFNPVVPQQVAPGVPQQVVPGDSGMAAPYMQQQAVLQQAGGFPSLFNGVGDAADSVLSGGRGLSLAALIPAAYLMFGNFGWMGKIASFLLGNFALKNLKSQQAMLPQQMVMTPQMQQQYQERVREQYDRDQAILRENENKNVIMRSRL